MTLRSMTGFARTNAQAEGSSWSWELKSVNAKGFDLRLRLPPGWDTVEADARRMIGTVIVRGTVHAALDIAKPERPMSVKLNQPMLEALARSLSAAATNVGLAPPSIDAILGVKGVVEIVEADADPGAAARLGEALSRTLEEAILALCLARQEEGEALKAVLVEMVAAIDALTRQADALPSRGAEAVKARLRRQIDDLFDAGAEQLDPQRLHLEAMLLLVKADIREELDRLKAHLAQASELLAKGGTVGRRLDFLAQELSREVNTICAKSNDVALTGIGLDLKTLVEQFREQVQNVE